MGKRNLPYDWCEPTCPRQATNSAGDCECGGAEKEWDFWKKIAEVGIED